MRERCRQAHLGRIGAQVAAEGDEQEVSLQVVLPKAAAGGGLGGGATRPPARLRGRLRRLLALQDVVAQVACAAAAPPPPLTVRGLAAPSPAPMLHYTIVATAQGGQGGLCAPCSVVTQSIS